MRVLVLLLGLAACGGAEAPASIEPAATTDASAAVLDKADQKDGAADKVVTKCPGCMLSMDGKAENALNVDGYELHFCSDSCKMNFDSDREAGMAKITKAVK